MTALPAATVRVPASDLRPGDLIHPPKRELSLWMLRHAEEQGKPSEWLTLLVSDVTTSSRAGFVIIEAHQPGSALPWRFLAKATTSWPVVARKAPEVARG